MPIIATEYGYVYKKNKKKTGVNKGVKRLLVFFVTVCLIAGLLYFFSAVDITNIFGLNKYKVFDATTYYGISVASGETHGLVSEFSSQIKQSGGSGYIYQKNGLYFCLASIYKTKQDADKVCQNLSAEWSASVVEISFEQLIVSKDYLTEQIETLKTCLKLVNSTFDNLYDICISFDKGEILEAEAKQKLQVFRETCQLDKETLSKQFQGNCDNFVTNVKIFQSEVVSGISALILSENLSVDIKWTIASVLESFSTLQKNITKWEVMKFFSDLIESFKVKHNVTKNVSVSDFVSNDGTGIVVFAPKNITELNKIIDCVAKGQTIIINFSNIKNSQFNKLADYLCGALYALKADIQCLQDALYVVTPQNIKLSTIK